jgi:uncharacterized protein YjbI with pentapeptide repeats
MALDGLQQTEQLVSGESALPAIAVKADDLEAIKKSVEDAATISGVLWLSYLFGLFYIALAAASVTHADLLLQNPVELPFLTIKLPLKAFFILAPLLFLISHAYTMAHFALLADKAKRFHFRLRTKIDDTHEHAHDIREGIRQQLPINMFVQFLAGQEDVREGPFSGLLWTIAWTSLVLGPVMVLLLLQLQFLPYHDSRVSWEHRVVLLVDLALIWWLWMRILSGRSKEDEARTITEAQSIYSAPVPNRKGAVVWRRFRNGFLWASRYVRATPLTFGIVVFSWWIAPYPGEWRQGPYSLAPSLEWSAANVWVFGEVDAQHGKITGGWPYNTLRLSGFNIHDMLKLDDTKKLERKEHIFDFQNRRLEYADFRLAKFGNVDLRGAHLDGALLFGAELPGAAILNAHLRGALLDLAHLQRAMLGGAELQGASLLRAELQGAWLVGARLQGASLDGAHFQGASLFKAQLQGASINEADLWGSLLTGAQLAGASLLRADLRGASLEMADLRGVSLEGAKLDGTELSRSMLWRNKFSDLALLDMGKIRMKEARSEPITPSIDHPSELWTEAGYVNLRREMERNIPEGERRDAALKRIERLDCRNPDKALASCNPGTASREEARDWRNRLKEGTSLSDAAYENALVKELRVLICSGAPDSILILQGILNSDVTTEDDLANLNRLGVSSGEDAAIARLAIGARVSRLAATNREAPALVDFIVSKDCPVSNALTEEDKAKLLQIKQDVEKNLPPSTAKP